MIEYVGYVVIPLICIDIFYILYSLFCKLMFKRYKFTENNLRAKGIEVEEEGIDNIKDIKVIIAYIISTFAGIVTIFTLEYSGSFLENLKKEFLMIWVIFLMFYSFYVLFRRIIYLFNYSRGFVENFRGSKQEKFENENENEEENEEVETEDNDE